MLHPINKALSSLRWDLLINESHDTYLGLPSFVGRGKWKIFGHIREKVYKKLQMWKAKMFSIGGREILIKTIAQATSTYAMSVFQLPCMLCDDLQSPISDFCGEVGVMIEICIGSNGRNLHGQKRKEVWDSEIKAKYFKESSFL